jgi:NAD(P)-dependent dehydrogenase (short-subunit alcohol dehydrogenase family)
MVSVLVGPTVGGLPDADRLLGQQTKAMSDNQVIVITGGSRGIGFAAAKELGSLGHTVALVGKSQERVQSSAEILVNQGIDAVGFAVDVADHEEVRQLIENSPLVANADVLLNSAGVMADKMSKTIRTSPQEWQRVMSTNLDGTFNFSSLIGANMAARRSGRIINVSACMGRFSGPGLMGGLAPYRISKTAVNALTKNLAAELGNGTRGVLVDAMCPNHCRTDMGGPDAPLSAEEGADTIVWLATREHNDQTQTGLLWEERSIVPW